MKRISVLLCVFFLLAAMPARSQTIAQVTEQLVLDIQKLSQLKGILNDMYKAYTVIDKGYTDIKNIAQGNFNLHKIFLDGLLAVSPTVRNYAKVADAISAEVTLVKEYKSAYQRFRQDGHFTLAELDFIASQYAALLDAGQKGITELEMVITDGQVRMSDAERLAAIDRICGSMTGNLAFLRQFNNTTTLQAVQRAREANDISTLQAVYGIKQ